MMTHWPADAMGVEAPTERVLIALVRAAWVASVQPNAVVRKAGMSPSQYNVLRILRHAGAGGLSRNEIGERMVTRDPDLTRILNGLARFKAVRTRRSEADGRSRVSEITAYGRTLLERLDGDVRAAATTALGGFTTVQLRQLERLLAAIHVDTET